MNTSWANETNISNEDDINTAVYLSFIILLFTLGLCGNSLILLAVKYEPQLRRYGYAFTVNSAVSDCAVLILADVFIITGIATDGNYLKQNSILCDLSSSICLSVCICSIWSHAAGSFHSYVRVCHRLQYHKIFNRNVVFSIIIFLWIGSQLVVLPTLLGWGGHTYKYFLGYCIPDHLISNSYTLFFLSVGIFLPLLISSFSFMRIACDVFMSRRRVHRRVSHRDSWVETRRPSQLPIPPRLNTHDTYLIRSFFFITLYLFSAWIFLVIIMMYGDTKSFTPTQIVVAVTLAHTHCSVNGVLYAMTNKYFRKAYADILSSCFKFCCSSYLNQKRPEVVSLEINIDMRVY